MVDAVNPPGLWQPFGPFSQIAIQDRALLVEISAIAEIPPGRFKRP